MRYAVMGAGALGGYIGGRLAASGNDVKLVARGAHLAAMQKDGLRIESPKGDAHIPQIRATDDPATVGIVDCILFLVKNFDAEASALQMLAMVGRDTVIIPFQNGVSAPDIVRRVTGSDNVLPGVIRFPADIRTPGVVRHSAPFDHVIFGETGGGISPRCLAVATDMKDAGLMARVADNIMQEIWDKLTMQASFASVTSLTRLDIGPIRDNAACSELFIASMQETETVARAVMPDLQPGMAMRAWEMLGTLPPNVHSSMLDDLQRGKPIEVDSLSGEVARLGEIHGIPTPLHGMFTAALQPFVNGTPS